MLKKCLLIVALALCVQSSLTAADRFSTNRLRQMALALPEIPFQKLDVGTHTEYRYMGHPLNIRVNKTREVEHIGYLLFNDSMRLQTSPVYDFVERYTLELEMMDEQDRNIRTGIDKFMFEIGSLQTIHQLRETDMIKISMLDNKGYRVAWYRENTCLLSMLFYMDYQMLVSSNAIELEQRYLRMVGRRDTLTYVTTPILEVDSSDFYAVEDNGSYLSDAIRAARYFERDTTGKWNPILSTSQSRWSASNLMLSPTAIGEYTLQCRLDMYGYQDSALSLSLSRWISETMQEGCKMYFGLKSRSNKVIHGTVFCPNAAAGYCHMMSVDIPVEAIEKCGGIIKGRLYVYIPLHNITNDYFDLNYLPIKKESQ